MPRGKAPESMELKAIVEAFESLHEQDRMLFRNKVFSKVCNGLPKNQREDFKKERIEFLARIEKAQKAAEQLQTISAISTEELEMLLAERKKTVME